MARSYQDAIDAPRFVPTCWRAGCRSTGGKRTWSATIPPKALGAAGTRITVLTNSLEATDVPAVHAGYAKRRVALLRAGIVLYELKRGSIHAPLASCADWRDRAAPACPAAPDRACTRRRSRSTASASSSARSTSIRAQSGSTLKWDSSSIPPRWRSPWSRCSSSGCDRTPIASRLNAQQGAAVKEGRCREIDHGVLPSARQRCGGAWFARVLRRQSSCQFRSMEKRLNLDLADPRKEVKEPLLQTVPPTLTMTGRAGVASR
jgi:hypothetical protein